MVEIFLSVNNAFSGDLNAPRPYSSNEFLEIPVIPKEIKFSKGEKSEVFETAAGTEFDLLTVEGLNTVEWSSFFPDPSHDYDFVRGNPFDNVMEYEKILKDWRNAFLPVRLVIYGNNKTICNIATKCTLSNCTIGPTGDLDYDIKFTKIPDVLIKEEELTMAQYEELKGEIDDIKKILDSLTKRYNFFDEEDFPEWAKEAAALLYNNGAIQQNESGLDLSYDMLRILTICERAQAFRNIVIYNYNDGNIPAYARGTINWLCSNGTIRGDEEGELDLTDDLIRAYVTVARAGGFGDECKNIALADADQGLID